MLRQVEFVALCHAEAASERGAVSDAAFVERRPYKVLEQGRWHGGCQLMGNVCGQLVPLKRLERTQ